MSEEIGFLQHFILSDIQKVQLYYMFLASKAFSSQKKCAYESIELNLNTHDNPSVPQRECHDRTTRRHSSHQKPFAESGFFWKTKIERP